MEEEVDLKKAIKIFWDRKIEIILIILLFVVIGYIYTQYFIQPEYTASATIILANNNQKQNTILTQSEIALNDKLIATYSNLAKSKSVLKKVIENLRLENIYNEVGLREKVKVAAITNTQVIKITATDKNPELAAKIANELTEVFTQKVSDVYNINNIKVLSNAEPQYKPSNINLKKNMLVFGLIGLALSIIYVIIANAIDTTIKDRQDIENLTSLNVLAELPIYNLKRGEKEIITHVESKSPISEVFRALRTNMQFMNKTKDCETILITSTVQSEGKSWIASNLAITFAQAGSKTLLIDADMRRARQHEIFETDSIPGLSNYLSNIGKDGQKEEFKTLDCILKTRVENLSLMPAGNIPPNPSELLVSSKTEELLKEVKENYDVVIFDGAPCLMVTDSTILSRMVSQTLLVTSYKTTKKEELKEVKKRIENVGGYIVGAVLNKVQISAKKYNSRYYYYSNEQTKRKIDNTKTESEKIENKVEEKTKEEPSEKVKEILADIEKYDE